MHLSHRTIFQALSHYSSPPIASSFLKIDTFISSSIYLCFALLHHIRVSTINQIINSSNSILELQSQSYHSPSFTQTLPQRKKTI